MIARIGHWMLALAVALAALGSLGVATAAPRNSARPALERAYMRNNALLEAAKARMAKANARAAWFAAWIADLKAQGKDVTALDVALRAFQAKVSQADKNLKAAAAILSAHAGFDDQGKLTNPAAAQATVTQASKSIEKMHGTLRIAHLNLRRAITNWRIANPGVPNPTLPRNE